MTISLFFPVFIILFVLVSGSTEFFPTRVVIAQLPNLAQASKIRNESPMEPASVCTSSGILVGYVNSDLCKVYHLDSRTGDSHFVQVGNKSMSFCTSIVLSSDESLVAILADNQIIVYNIEKGLSVSSSPYTNSSMEMGSMVSLSSNSVVGLTEKGLLFKYDLESLRFEWRVKFAETAGLIVNPVVLGEYIYFIHDNQLNCAMVSNGELLWGHFLDESIVYNGLSGDGESLYLLSKNAFLIFHLPTREVVWSHRSLAPYIGPVLVRDSSVFVSSRLGALELEKETMNVLRIISSLNPIARAFVSGGMLVQSSLSAPSSLKVDSLAPRQYMSFFSLHSYDHPIALGDNLAFLFPNSILLLPLRLIVTRTPVGHTFLLPTSDTFSLLQGSQGLICSRMDMRGLYIGMYSTVLPHLECAAGLLTRGLHTLPGSRVHMRALSIPTSVHSVVLASEMSPETDTAASMPSDADIHESSDESVHTTTYKEQYGRLSLRSRLTVAMYSPFNFTSERYLPLLSWSRQLDFPSEMYGPLYEHEPIGSFVSGTHPETGAPTPLFRRRKSTSSVKDEGNASKKENTLIGFGEWRALPVLRTAAFTPLGVVLFPRFQLLLLSLADGRTLTNVTLPFEAVSPPLYLFDDVVGVRAVDSAGFFHFLMLSVRTGAVLRALPLPHCRPGPWLTSGDAGIYPVYSEAQILLEGAAPDLQPHESLGVSEEGFPSSRRGFVFSGNPRDDAILNAHMDYFSANPTNSAIRSYGRALECVFVIACGSIVKVSRDGRLLANKTLPFDWKPLLTPYDEEEEVEEKVEDVESPSVQNLNSTNSSLDSFVSSEFNASSADSNHVDCQFVFLGPGLSMEAYVYYGYTSRSPQHLMRGYLFAGSSTHPVLDAMTAGLPSPPPGASERNPKRSSTSQYPQWHGLTSMQSLGPLPSVLQTRPVGLVCDRLRALDPHSLLPVTPPFLAEEEPLQNAEGGDPLQAEKENGKNVLEDGLSKVPGLETASSRLAVPLPFAHAQIDLEVQFMLGLLSNSRSNVGNNVLLFQQPGGRLISLRRFSRDVVLASRALEAGARRLDPASGDDFAENEISVKELPVEYATIEKVPLISSVSPREFLYHSLLQVVSSRPGLTVLVKVGQVVVQSDDFYLVLDLDMLEKAPLVNNELKAQDETLEPATAQEPPLLRLTIVLVGLGGTTLLFNANCCRGLLRKHIRRRSYRRVVEDDNDDVSIIARAV